MKNLFVICVLLLTLSFSETLCQRRINRKLLNIFGKTAYSYLLSANRPGYGVDAYVSDKGSAILSLGISYSDDVIDIPISFSYGLSNKVELSAGISPFTQSYNFYGDKISGVGDSYIGIKYAFLESEHFIHAIQGIFKIPTASNTKELGTGKTDLYMGIAQGFVSGSFGYDLSIEINFLQRRDFPETRKYIPVIQLLIDSTKRAYDYNIEPELVISAGPSVDISKNISIYSGFAFSRNMRLNYNTSTVYAGFGIGITKRINFSAGAFYGLDEAGTWGSSGGLNFQL
ncbi:MAG: hypothetical protein IT280_01070 [Ignavibacteria bacterium]|nr:hypothetical protein [Ignavibacteria bacterium]